MGARPERDPVSTIGVAVKEVVLKIVKNKGVRVAALGLGVAVAAALGFNVDLSAVLALFGG